jgi:L-iditol 2-dehydrogenase
MKSIKLVAPKQFEIYNEETPIPDQKNNVLIKIAEVGVCGSDMHYYRHGKIGEELIKFPFTIGHEASGYIEKIIGDSKGLKIGQLVAIEPAVTCGECDQCKAGRPHTCRHNLFMGGAGQLEGLSREYVTVPASNVFVVPEKFMSREAAFVEPMSIGTYAVKLVEFGEKEEIGIIGAGPIGMTVLMALQYSGNKKHYVWDKLDYRLKNAQMAGALWTANPDKVNIDDELHKVLPRELDIVFECCGDQDALNTALKVLKPGGKLVIVGIPTEDRISFDMNILRRKEIAIINVRRQNHSVPDAIKVIDHFRPLSDNLITHTFDASKTNEAFKMVSDYAGNVVKAMIKF